MKKVFYLTIMLICSFGFIGVANAESSLGEELMLDTNGGSYTDINDTLNGGTVFSKFTDKYDFYYKAVKILFDGIGNGCGYFDEGNEKSLKEYIPEINSIDDLNGYTKIESIPMTPNWEYEKFGGYVIALVAVDKKDNSKIYVDRNIYDIVKEGEKVLVSNQDNCSAGDPASQYIRRDGKTYNDDVDLNYSSDNYTTTQTYTNPETGLNDYIIYILPIILIVGSYLVIRKRIN